MTSDKSYATEARLNALAPLISPTGNQTINAAFAVQIGNLAYTVAAGGAYLVRARILGQALSPGGASLSVGITGPAVNWCWIVHTETSTVTPPVLEHKGFSSSLTSFGTFAYATAAVWVSEFEATVSFSAGGTLAVGGGNGAGPVNWTALSEGCYLQVLPAVPV